MPCGTPEANPPPPQGGLCRTVDYLIDASRPLAPNELITSDPLAQEIVMDYQKLSQDGKRQVRDFVKFLINEEQRRRRELIREKTSAVIRQKE